MSERTRAAWVAAGMFIVWVVYGQLSTGTFNDDDIVHYFLARRSLEDPELFLSLWGRPLHTLLYALPARLGYGATEVLTAAISAFTVFLTWVAATQMGLRSRAVAFAAAAVQPFVFKMGYSCLVEPLGALIVVGSLVLARARRFALAALVIGLLPLSRLELVAVVPFVLWPAFRAIGIRALGLAALGLATWHVSGAVAESDPIWLWNQITGGHFTRSFDGARPLVHYFRSLPMVTGGVLFALVVVGLVRPLERTAEGDRVRLMFVSLLGVLALLAWDAHEFGGSVGYLRHLVSAGPLIALLAAMGADRWAASRDRAVTAIVIASTLGVVAMAVFRVDYTVWEHPVARTVEPWVWPLGAGAALLAMAWGRRPAGVDRWQRVVILLAAVATLVAEPPIQLDGERKAMQNADRWIRENLPGRPIAVNHPWFFFLGKRDRFDRVRYPGLNHETLRSLPPRALVLWEDHYSARLSGDVRIEHFVDHPERYLPRHKEFVSHQFKYIIFEVIDG